MKINTDLPIPAIEYEPVLSPQQLAEAKAAIAEQRERRNELDRLAGRHPDCYRGAALASIGVVDP